MSSTDNDYEFTLTIINMSIIEILLENIRTLHDSCTVILDVCKKQMSLVYKSVFTYNNEKENYYTQYQLLSDMFTEFKCNKPIIIFTIEIDNFLKFLTKFKTNTIEPIILMGQCKNNLLSLYIKQKLTEPLIMTTEVKIYCEQPNMNDILIPSLFFRDDPINISYNNFICLLNSASISNHIYISSENKNLIIKSNSQKGSGSIQIKVENPELFDQIEQRALHTGIFFELLEKYGSLLSTLPLHDIKANTIEICSSTKPVNKRFLVFNINYHKWMNVQICFES